MRYTTLDLLSNTSGYKARIQFRLRYFLYIQSNTLPCDPLQKRSCFVDTLTATPDNYTRP